MALVLLPLEQDIFRIVQSIRQLIQGRSDAVVHDVTLTPSATTTVVEAINCSKDSEVFLSPRTASAAAAIPTTWVSAVNNGSFELTHSSDVAVDRDFGAICLGG